MNTIDLNYEWNFIVAETHGEKPNKTNIAKREMLFTLQILLAKFELATAVSETSALKQNYSALKEVYCLR